MARKTEGTFYLDGLLEGRLFSEEDERHVRRFVDATQKDGLAFYLKIDRDHFSLLPSQQTCKEKTFGVSVDSLLKRHIETLLEHYSPQECAAFMSTLRSVEYIKGFEKQSIYGIDNQGSVVVEKRTVPAETVPPEAQLTLKQKLQYIGFLSVILLLMFLISAFFVPYKQMISSVIESVRSYNLKQLTVSGETYSNYFFLEEAAINPKDQTFMLVFRATDAYPQTKEQLNAEWLRAADDIEGRLAVEALARESLRCVLFDKAGQFYAEHTVRMIWTKERTGFALAMPFSRQVGEIELSY